LHAPLSTFLDKAFNPFQQPFFIKPIIKLPLPLLIQQLKMNGERSLPDQSEVGFVDSIQYTSTYSTLI
jgi:hypothetical protein